MWVNMLVTFKMPTTLSLSTQMPQLQTKSQEPSVKHVSFQTPGSMQAEYNKLNPTTKNQQQEAKSPKPSSKSPDCCDQSKHTATSTAVSGPGGELQQNHRAWSLVDRSSAAVSVVVARAPSARKALTVVHATYMGCCQQLLQVDYTVGHGDNTYITHIY